MSQSALASSYQTDGFLINEQALMDAGLTKAARQAMDDIRVGRYQSGIPPMPSAWQPGDDPQALCKIEMPHRADHRLCEFLRSPALGEQIAAVTGASMVQIWWVQLLYKPSSEARSGTKVGWHRDRSYWSCFTEDSELLTAWCALEDVGLDSGPMELVPGSHTWVDCADSKTGAGGMVGEGGDFFAQDIDASSFAVPAGQQWQQVPAVMPAGAFSLHDQLTLHASGPNHSGKARCSLAVHVRTNRSKPRNGERQGLTAFLDDDMLNPIIYGERCEEAFSGA